MLPIQHQPFSQPWKLPILNHQPQTSQIKFTLCNSIERPIDVTGCAPIRILGPIDVQSVRCENFVGEIASVRGHRVRGWCSLVASWLRCVSSAASWLAASASSSRSSLHAMGLRVLFVVVAACDMSPCLLRIWWLPAVGVRNGRFNDRFNSQPPRHLVGGLIQPLRRLRLGRCALHLRMILFEWSSSRFSA